MEVGRQRWPEHLIKIDDGSREGQSGLTAMGRKGDEQVGLFVPYHQLGSAGHPFYQALEAILRNSGFDKYAEKRCSTPVCRAGNQGAPRRQGEPCTPGAIEWFGS